MRYRDNLQAWKALSLVAMTGNLTESAILLDIDTSKASRLITGLEKELGFPLLIKNRRPFVPTDRCASLLEFVRPLLTEFQKVDEMVEGAPEKKIYKIAGPIEMMQQFYSDHLLNYTKQHPDILFSTVPEATRQDLIDGKVDIAITNHRPFDMTNLVARHYITNSTPVFASPEYLRRHGTPQTPADLAKHTGALQVMPGNTPTLILYKDGEASEIIHWKHMVLSHDQNILKKMVLSHQAIAVDLFAGHIIEELERGEIVPILEGWERAPWNMHIVTRKDKDLEDQDLRAFALWFVNFEGQACMNRLIRAKEAIMKAKYRHQKEAGK